MQNLLVQRIYAATQQQYLCQCSGLVGEDVLDLPKLFIECHRDRPCRSIVLGIVHLSVPVDPYAVPKTDQLHATNSAHTQFLKCERLGVELQLFAQTHQIAGFYYVCSAACFEYSTSNFHRQILVSVYVQETSQNILV